MDALLNRLYHDPETGYISAQKLYQKPKPIDKSVTLKKVKEWYSKQPDIQQYQEKRPDARQYKITSHDPNSWQMDLTFHDGAIILSAVNINSRLGYARVLPDKKAPTVLIGLKDFVQKHKPTILTTDNGSEFMNDKAEKFLRSKDIEHYNNEPGEHTTMGKIERFNRTLKQRLTKIGRKVTQDLLTNVIKNYNSTFHSGIKATPNEMKGNVIESELQHNRDIADKLNETFSVGQSVVYRLPKSTFGKEKALWSKTVYEIIDTDGYKFQIRSKNRHTLYKSHSDLKVVQEKPSDAPLTKKDNIYEVERILDHQEQKNGKFKYLIKWLGYDETSWEPEGNLRLINKNKMSKMEKDYWHGLRNLP
ncbi:unnamed protein product [Phytophthora lilii]|uniref:Unnamed protein product n=1 Tax=Phytophthora lilii TaxID=2077276 RepID=A0A9W6X082_9STRA|nr:unnamed protein product [Phytophthora lilii]